MLFSFVFSLLFSVAFAYTGLHKRFEGISVELVGPTRAVHSTDDLKFTASVKNSGDQAIKMLRYGTILDETVATPSFEVTKNGTVVPFTGIKLSISFADLDDSAFVVIPAGGGITVKHEASFMFDFASAGPGAFSFEPITHFHVLGAEEKIGTRPTQIHIPCSKINVDLTSISRRESALIGERAVDICTTASRKSFIDVSYAEAKSLSSSAAAYISTNGAADALYRAYFGATPVSRVISVFNAVATENSSTRTLSCVDTFGACTSGVLVYSIISTHNIYFCPLFFSLPPTSGLCSGTAIESHNTRGGITLLELVHAVLGTTDIQFGCTADQTLSDADSIANADNYVCFATQVYANTHC